MPPLTNVLTGKAFSNDTFVLTHESTYNVLTASVVPFASFVGTTETTITTGAVVQAPQGAAAGTCTGTEDPIIPSAVTIDAVKITGAGVNCSKASGTSGHYLRVSTAVTFDFTVECAITGNVPTLMGSVTGQVVRHVIVGSQIPCLQSFDPPGLLNGCAPAGPMTASSVMQTTFAAVSST